MSKKKQLPTNRIKQPIYKFLDKFTKDQNFANEKIKTEDF